VKEKRSAGFEMLVGWRGERDAMNRAPTKAKERIPRFARNDILGRYRVCVLSRQ
jgi:hypothetical protein